MIDLSSQIRAAADALSREASEAAKTAEEQHQPTLALARRLIAVVRAVLDETKSAAANRGWAVIVTALLVKSIATVRAAVTVGSAGHGREMGVMVRSALESLVNATFIAKEDSDARAKRWVEYGIFLRARLLRKQPNLSKTEEHQKARDIIIAQAAPLEPLFPNAGFWASGLGKGSLRDLAVDVHMEWYYDYVYWSGSQDTHGSAVSVEGYMGQSADGTPLYKLGLSSDHMHGELSVCCDILIRVLELFNRALQLGLDTVVEELVGEYKAAFGHPLLQEAEGQLP